MKKLYTVLVLAVMIVGITILSKLLTEDNFFIPWSNTTIMPPTKSAMVAEGAKKADVRKICNLLISSPERFEKYKNNNGVVEGQVTIDNINYELSYKPNYLRLDLVVTDGSTIFYFRDISADGLVDGSSLAKYSYLYFGYYPVSQSKTEAGSRDTMDLANRNYSTYITALSAHF